MARTLEELNRTLAELGERQEKRRRLLAQWSVLREEADKRSARAEELKQVLAKERRDVEELASALGERGVAVRAGFHCAPLAHQTAGTLETGTVRLSFSDFNTMEEVYRFLTILREILR